jgi:hypothetical protein
MKKLGVTCISLFVLRAEKRSTTYDMRLGSL